MVLLMSRLGKLVMQMLMILMAVVNEGWRSVDGMLPVNTAGSPGGGLQWPSRGGGDLVELAMQKMLWIQLVWQLVADWCFRSALPLQVRRARTFRSGFAISGSRGSAPLRPMATHCSPSGFP